MGKTKYQLKKYQDLIYKNDKIDDFLNQTNSFVKKNKTLPLNKDAINCIIFSHVKKESEPPNHSFETDNILIRENLIEKDSIRYRTCYGFKNKELTRYYKEIYTHFDLFNKKFLINNNSYKLSGFNDCIEKVTNDINNFNHASTFDISRAFYSIKYKVVFNKIKKYFNENFNINEKQRALIHRILLILEYQYKLIEKFNKNTYLFITPSSQILFNTFIHILIEELDVPENIKIISYVDDFLLLGKEKEQLDKYRDKLINKLKKYNLFTPNITSVDLNEKCLVFLKTVFKKKQ